MAVDSSKRKRKNTTAMAHLNGKSEESYVKVPFDMIYEL